MTRPGDDAPDPQLDDGGDRARPGASSPYATGGGGVTLERRAAALYLARLFTGDTAPELGDDRRVVGVAFQQAPAIAVDDLVILAARPGEHAPSLQLAIAVRRRPNVVRSDAEMPSSSSPSSAHSVRRPVTMSASTGWRSRSAGSCRTRRSSPRSLGTRAPSATPPSSLL